MGFSAVAAKAACACSAAIRMAARVLILFDMQALKEFLANRSTRETVRLFLILVVGIHLYALYNAWQAWQKETATTDSPPHTSASALPTEAPASTAADAPTAIPLPKSQATSNDVPDSVILPQLGKQSLDPLPAASATPIAAATTVEAETDGYTATLTSRGGDLDTVALHDFFNDDDGTPYQILGKSDPNYLVLQSGVVSNSKTELPTLTSEYALTQKKRLSDNESIVEFTWRGQELTVAKQYRFVAPFEIEKTITVSLNSTATDAVSVFPFVQQVAAPRQPPTFSASYIGAAVYQDEQGYKKIKYDDIAESDFAESLKNSWMVFVDQYYVSAWLPSKDQEIKYYTKPSANQGKVILGGFMEGATLNPGESQSWQSKLFIGPKSNQELKKTDESLLAVIDYGFLGFLSKPMFWLLNFFFGLMGNWGWAIIFLTFVIRAILYKPAEIAFVSMARIKKFQPEMVSLKERFGDDRQKLGVEMMKLYKEHKINPLSGCLPILLQIPVFIALFWMLSETVELKYAPWILWITDLSKTDPYFVLPLLMAMTMVIQQKLTTQPTDPLQQKIFSMLPIVFGAMSVFFPAGLVLYWVANNVLSIIQQTIIERKLARAEHH